MPIVRLPTGELRDEIRQPVYDTIVIGAAVNPVGTREFFSSVQGKSLIQTNLKQNKLLETAVSFRVQGLALDAQNFRLANRLALPLIMERSSIEFVVGEKTYFTGNARYLAGRIWQHTALSNQAAPTDAILQEYGQAAVQAVMLQGKHVIDINPLQSFFARWVVAEMSLAEQAEATPAADTELRFMFKMAGLLRRPVQ